MEEPSRSELPMPVTHTAVKCSDHSNAAEATRMSYGMHFIFFDKHNTFLRLKLQ